MTPFDLISLAKQAQSVEELITLAEKDRIKLSEEDARIYFDRWHGTCALSDDDLDMVGGGYEETAEGRVVCEVCGSDLSIDLSAGGYYCNRCRKSRTGMRTF